MNRDIVDSIIEKCSRTGVIIDSNILLLYLSGLGGLELISSVKRLKNAYSEEDFLTLAQFLQPFKQVIYTTPTILAEVNSLSNSLSGKYRRIFTDTLSKYTEYSTKELYIKIIDYNDAQLLFKFGVTDSNIIQLANQGYLILTDDLQLSQYLHSRSLNTLNFNNIRIYGW